MGLGAIVPPLVCVSLAGGDGAVLVHHADPALPEFLQKLFLHPDQHIVGARISYDMAVLCNRFPSLWSPVWAAYEAGRIHDVQLIERLLAISTTGDLEWIRTPGGGAIKREYSLAALAKKYLGVNRDEAKKGEDSWRKRYEELIDVPLEQWPEEAKIYATDDARDTMDVYLKQLELVESEDGPGSIGTETFQAAADFALHLITAWGLPTDQRRVDLIEAKLNELLHPERLAPLYRAGLVTPASPGRPKKVGTGMTQPKPEKVNTEPLRAHFEAVAARNFVTLELTETKKQTSTGADSIEKLRRFDPIIELYAQRQEVVKLRTSFVPVLRAPVVRFKFNSLVSSGRTSSSADENYPSTNGQNQPRAGGELSIRECFLPRPGHLLVSSDYGFVELCTTAQTCLDLLGRSTLAQKINAGFDPHAYLGSQLAATLDPEFQAAVEGADPDEIYRGFLTLKKSDDLSHREFYKHWRHFAKPTGLGYPGGLGPATFCDYARATFGIDVKLDVAESLRTVWFRTYPEMRAYFEWVSRQTDPRNIGLFAYRTPFGMYRAGCTYTEIANGMCMQSPTAEGAKAAVFRVVRACFDPAEESCLYGCHPVNFIHDEMLVEIPDDAHREVRAMEVSRLMVESIRKTVLKDVEVRAEPALMRRWYKDAEPVRDAQGRLVPWEPEA